jgi:hypothetical protein
LFRTELTRALTIRGVSTVSGTLSSRLFTSAFSVVPGSSLPASRAVAAGGLVEADLDAELVRVMVALHLDHGVLLFPPVPPSGPARVLLDGLAVEPRAVDGADI